MKLITKSFTKSFTKLLIYCFGLFLLSSPAVFAEGISLARFPGLSPDGATLAFSYRGDIWTAPADGGTARRLTVHAADDIRPRFSPDGRYLAFSSKRNGNHDIYIMDVTNAGAPRQLTFRSDSDYVTGWTPDSKHVIFHSRRDMHHYYGGQATYKISVTGGMPVPLINQVAYNGAMSTDQHLLAFNINRMTELRQRYRGSSNNDIHTYDFRTGTYNKLTDHPGNDKWPIFGGQSIYYVSDSDNTFNIWKMNPDGANKTQLTFHKGDQVRYPTVSADGKTLVYEYLDRLYRKDEGKEPYPLVISAPADYKSNPLTVKELRDGAEEIAVSADGTFTAFVIRGEIFLLKKKWTRAKNITNNSAREKDISWSPDGKTLLFSSDREGSYDLYQISSAGEKDIYHTFDYRLTRLTDTPAEEYGAAYSPDGKSILYIEGKGNLVIIDSTGKNKTHVLKSWNVEDPCWSPDGAYLAYAHMDNNYNGDVYIYEIASGKAHNISMHPDNDYMPRWSPDGRFIYFLSKRINDNVDIWRTALQKKWHDMTKDEWQEFLEREEEKKKSKKDKKDKKDTKDKKNKKDKKGTKDTKDKKISIDFDEIHLRMTHLTRLLGEELELVVGNDSKDIVFIAGNDGGRGIYTIKWDGTGQKTLVPSVSRPSDLTVTDTPGVVHYVGAGKIYSLKIKGGKPEGIAFNARLQIDRIAESGGKFDEAWRLLRDNFYDPKFHGADWHALREKFRPWAANTATMDEFNHVFSLMLGELNSSHLGIYGPGPRRGGHKSGDTITGLIGVEFDPAFTGPGFKVKDILRHSPAERHQSRLHPGDIITAVNGETVQKNDNFYRLMADTAKEKVRLQVSRKNPKQEQNLEVVITPVQSQRSMLYETWVHRNRQKVDRLSDGRLAYLHIQSMGTVELERFEHELYSAAHGKEGMVIDVRYNGGGWITDYLLQILMTRQHAVTVPRDGGKGYPHSRRSIFSWSKPIVVLINQQCFSNAEIFPWSIRTLKRGPLVGKQTFGGVISTGGARLIDGSFVRLPLRGWYVNDGTMTNQELNGCPPDYPVDNLPGEENAGIDRQLDKAVEVLKQDVEKAKTQDNGIWKG